MSKLKKLVIVLAILVVAIPTSAFGYVYFKLNGMHDSSVDDTALKNTDYKAEEGITNILLVGIDAENSNEGNRSDSMMILTLDQNNKNIRLTSLARDTYADIPSHGKQKLTHAYSYGGISLLTQTIEKNFEMDIQNYVIVNFASFMDIIDAINGVTVNIEQGELKQLEQYTRDCYNRNKNKNKGDLEIIDTVGEHNLKGYQALAFSRIRYNDTAFERDNRQRQVIESVINKVKDLPVTNYPKLLNTILPYVKTNMNAAGMLSLGTKVLGFDNLGITQFEYPIVDEVHSIGKDWKDGKGWVLKFKSEDDSSITNSLDILHDFVFNNKIYQP